MTSNSRPRFPWRTLTLAAVLVLADLGGARLLDALGLVERLLSPHGGTDVWLVRLAALFYAARFAALFVAPGLVLGALVLWALERRAARAA